MSQKQIMYADENLLMISALQYLAFCERQCALIHLEQQWAENRFTVLGELLHEKVHNPESDKRADLTIVKKKVLYNQLSNTPHIFFGSLE